MRISKSTRRSVKASKSAPGWADFMRSRLVDAGHSWEEVKNMPLTELRELCRQEGIDLSFGDDVDACSDVKASTSTDKALKHIKAAIDILGNSGKKDAVTKDSIANLGVVMFDLKGKK